MGMELLHQKDYPKGEFTLAFLGYGSEEQNTVLELTYNWGVDSYDIGSGYGHIAIQVPDVYKAADAVKDNGGKIIREAGPMNAGMTIIAFAEDPDGYQIEFIGEDHVRK